MVKGPRANRDIERRHDASRVTDVRVATRASSETHDARSLRIAEERRALLEDHRAKLREQLRMQMRADEVAAEAALLKTELAKLKDEEKTVPEPTSHAKRKQPEPDVMVALKKAKKVPRGTKAEAKVRSHGARAGQAHHAFCGYTRRQAARLAGNRGGLVGEPREPSPSRALRGQEAETVASTAGVRVHG